MDAEPSKAEPPSTPSIKKSFPDNLFGLTSGLEKLAHQLPEKLNDWADHVLEGQTQLMEGVFDELRMGVGLISNQRDTGFVILSAQALNKAMSVYHLREKAAEMGGAIVISQRGRNTVSDEATKGLMNIINLTVRACFKDKSRIKPADNEDIYRRQLSAAAALSLYDDARRQKNPTAKQRVAGFARSVLHSGAENNLLMRSVISQLESRCLVRRNDPETDKTEIAELAKRYINTQ